VEEKLYQLQSGEAGRKAAESAVQTAEEQFLAAEARVELSSLDVLVAQAKAGVAEAHLAKARQMADFAKILSPYDGIVTERNHHRGEFVRAATQGGEKPLLRVARTDHIRVVVQVPDRDVPYAHAGDPIEINFDALPGRAFKGTLSRISYAEDAATRTMRAEVDLPNPDLRIVDQMYGRMEIMLEQPSDATRLPSGCLVGEVRDGEGRVFVVRDGAARLVPVKVAADDGREVEIVSGLSTTDDVVVRAPPGLTDGSPVAVSP
jgi:RND family efflux transporter MFP subunit